MKKMKLLKSVMIGGEFKKAGSVIEVSEGVAKLLAHSGKAEESKAKPEEKKDEKKKEEK